MYIFLSILLTLICFLLCIFIMMQNQTKGFSDTFGGQKIQMFGIQRANDFFEKSTWILSVIIFILILILNYNLRINKVEII